MFESSWGRVGVVLELCLSRVGLTWHWCGVLVCDGSHLRVEVAVESVVKHSLELIASAVAVSRSQVVVLVLPPRPGNAVQLKVWAMRVWRHSGRGGLLNLSRS